MSNIFTVYSQRLAGYLMMNGFPLLQIKKNPKTEENNFLFPNNENLQDCINKWQLNDVILEGAAIVGSKTALASMPTEILLTATTTNDKLMTEIGNSKKNK